MTSTITLYYKSLINKEKNFVLDNLSNQKRIEAYLLSLNYTTIQNFQYIKQQLSVSIKINKAQANLEMIDSNDLNYVRIQNGSEKKYYYFVISKRWISKETIELVLSMDTLNTFHFNVDYVINKKSLVKRMHKDRFFQSLTLLLRGLNTIDPIPDRFKDVYLFGNLNFINEETQETYMMKDIQFIFRSRGTIISRGLRILNLNEEYSKFILDNRQSTSWRLNSLSIDRASPIYYILFEGAPLVSSIDFASNVIRKIDLKSEDISSPVYKTTDETLYPMKYDLIDWSLYYRNRDNQENSPVECFLVPSDPVKIKIQTISGELNTANIPLNKYVLFYSSYPAGVLTFSTSSGNMSIGYDAKTGRDVCVCVAVFNDNGNIRFFLGQFAWQWLVGTTGQWTEIPTSFVKVLNSPEYIYGYSRDSLPPTNNTQNIKAILYTYTDPALAITEIHMTALTDYTMAGKPKIDKTLSENIKIINIPYLPTITSINDGIYEFDSCWSYEASADLMKLVDFNKRFKNTIVTNVSSPLDSLMTDIYPLDIDLSATRYIIDSKVFHSDYYRLKFVYDSFTKIFPLEQIDYTQSVYNIYTSSSFEVTSNVNKFHFDFVMSRNIVSKFLFKFDFAYIHSSEDYPNIVAVARNNEEVLYSSQYLDYIRTGYNYDLKAKERQETASGIGIGLSVAGLIASGVVGFATGNPIAVGGAIASGVGLATSLVNFAKTTAQNEDNIQRKLAEAQRQSVSVLNADDYDLLYEYTNNKAKLCTYKVSSNMQKVLDDLFYYCGYIINEQMIPIINSRYWFNFVQASLIISESANLTSEIEDDIKEKFEQGVTFLHEHSGYDFNQEKENWERSLL